FDKMEFPDYVFQEFPKMLYAPSGASVTVENDAAEAALEGEWFATPALAKAAKAAAAAPAPA
ncbi:hypothetical protein, partial [Streptococcus pneumoniae]|uniref:hypothetical protein n=1 Tax=Streptococcus pneumoniae TaxID=1313 RepID=UPI0018B085FF